MKEHGFRWAPSVGAWQRLLNGNAYYAADRSSKYSAPFRQKPTELQRNSSRGSRRHCAGRAGVILPGTRATPAATAGKTCYLQAHIPQGDGRAKIGEVLYAGTPENAGADGSAQHRELTQEAVKELYAKEGTGAAEQEPTLNRRHQSRSLEQEPRRSWKRQQEDTSDAEPQENPPKTLTGVAEKGGGNRRPIQRPAPARPRLI